MTKSFFIYLIIFFSSGFYSVSFPQNPQWEKQSSPVSVTLRNLIFVDSLTGWAAGDLGTIVHTSDGGQNWEIQNSTLQTFIMDIFFINKDVGWALSLRDVFPFNSVILKTTNGGADWITEDFPDPEALLRTIFFFDSLNGFIGGNFIAYTYDGGNNWTEADVDSGLVSNLPVINFNFFSRQFGYACGGRIDLAGVIWRTTNYGLNWSSINVSPDEVFDIFVLDSLNAISLSGDPEGFFGVANIRTTDAGLSWTSDDLLFFGLSFAIDFRTWNEGWSASGYKFIFTSDRGTSWLEVLTPDSSSIYDIQFVNARTGYAVGENGAIYKLDPATVDVEDEIYQPDNFILFQNYPNPFNPSTKIKFTIATSPYPSPYQGEGTRERSLVTLKVYDVLGNEIAELVNEVKEPGVYEVVFDGTSRTSGIYFYRLIADNFSETKKMILLK